MIEIKLPRKTFHATLWLLSDPFDSGPGGPVDPRYLDRIVDLAIRASNRSEAFTFDGSRCIERLDHMGQPHPAETWDLRHV